MLTFLLLCSFVAVCFSSGDNIPSTTNSCRSSSRAVVWWNKIPGGHLPPAKQQRRVQLQKDDILCQSQTLEDAKQEAWQFLRKHVMEFDKSKLDTLGFGAANNTSGPDGLDHGVIGTTIDLAFQAKQKYPWTDKLPKEIFYEYVLNYASMNEARSNWRQLLWDILDPMVQKAQVNALDSNDVVRLVNQKLWSAFPGDNTIYFKSSQTPLIFDPMSVIAFGYASCTGLAILFVNALRTVGIAARVVGTPAWNGHRDKGNHNWVEVYDMDSIGGDGQIWKFFEPSANQTYVDDLHTQPCSKWFCNPGRFPSTGATKAFSARLVFDSDKTYCPLAWEWDCHDVPGEDRTDYYTQICSQC